MERIDMAKALKDIEMAVEEYAESLRKYIEYEQKVVEVKAPNALKVVNSQEDYDKYAEAMEAYKNTVDEINSEGQRWNMKKYDDLQKLKDAIPLYDVWFKYKNGYIKKVGGRPTKIEYKTFEDVEMDRY